MSLRGSYPSPDRGRGRGRGGGRGRGRGGSWRGGSNFRQGSALSADRPPPKPLGPTVDQIDIKTLLTEVDAPKIKNVEYLASYNWVNGKSPTILVPGSPPAWTPPATDSRLSPDSGDVFRDINAARYASYPLEPTFRSLRAMNPLYDLQAIDVVGCGSTLGNLMRFARSEPKDFRFDVDVIGDTVLFIRRESSPTELLTDLQGCGHTFPEAYTTWDPDVRSSCSHQRIIGYDFDGLKLLVRTETDAYLKEDFVEETISDAQINVPDSTDQIPLEDELESMTVSSIAPSQNQKLELRNAGKRVPQSQIFDIKTRADYKIFDMDEILPRLWLNQTPNFLIAFHKSRLFNRPEVKNVREDILQWEKDNSPVLALFHAVVERIVGVMLESDQPLCEVSWDGKGRLYITERIEEENRALPPDLVELLEAQS